MKTIFLTTFLVLFTACSTPHIFHSDNILQISLDNKVIARGYGDLIYKNRINLVNLSIDQKVFKMEDGPILTYEDSTVSPGYIYSYGMKRVVGIVFPDYFPELLDTNGNLFFFKLQNPEDTQYLILENINKKRVKMVYGLSQELFNSIHHSLKNNIETHSSHDSKKEKSVVSPDKHIKSKWNSKNIILDVLIKKMGLNTKVGI